MLAIKLCYMVAVLESDLSEMLLILLSNCRVEPTFFIS